MEAYDTVGKDLKSALDVLWIGVDSTVNGVYGNQKGALGAYEKYFYIFSK